ncbi:MAG: DUF6125 family protein [Bacillota bacterium]
MNVLSLKNELEKMSREEMIKYIDELHKFFWNIQGNWMQFVSEKYGTEAAREGDTRVFGRNGEVQGWLLKKLFGLGESMEDLGKALVFSTMLSNVEYEISEVSDRHIRARVTKCHMQLGRRKSGLPELPCKEAGLAALGRFGRAVNPDLEIECIVCPPDEHPEDLWCEWEWRIKE